MISYSRVEQELVLVDYSPQVVYQVVLVVEQVVVDQDTIVVEQEIHLLQVLLKVNPVEVPLLVQVLVVAAVEQEQQVLEAEMGPGQNQLQVI